jgi:hypothetical protein
LKSSNIGARTEITLEVVSGVVDSGNAIAVTGPKGVGFPLRVRERQPRNPADRGGSMKRIAPPCVVLAAAALVLSVCAHAETLGSRSRSIQGRVSFTDGEPASGAAVEIENLDTLNIRSFITQKGGTYHFNELYSNADYRVRAEYHGVFGPAKALSRFGGRKKTTINLTVGASK